MGVVSHSYGGLGGVGMEVVVNMLDKVRWDWSQVRRCWGTSRVRGEDTNHTALRCAALGSQAGIGQSSEEGLNTGHHEKAPDRRPCSRMATLHGAPWMRLLASSPPASAMFLSPSSASSPPLVDLDIDENNWDGWMDI